MRPRPLLTASIAFALLVHRAATAGHISDPSESDSQAIARNLHFADGILQSSEMDYIIGAPWHGEYRPLLFEANVAPQFFLFSRRGIDRKDLVGGESHHYPLQVVVVPKIVLRMLHEHSQPVRTPSFMPRVDIYRRLGTSAKSMFDDSAQTPDYLFLRVSHHSNGQSEDYLSSDRSINYDFGSWATNFLEVGVSRRLPGLPNLVFWRAAENRWIDSQLSLEAHPAPGAGGRDHDATQGYASYRVNYTTSAMLWESSKEASLSDRTQLWLWCQFTGLFGSMQSQFDDTRRLATRARLVWRPGGPADSAFMVEVFAGQDYYNINYTHYLKRIAAGYVIWPRTASSTAIR